MTTHGNQSVKFIWKIGKDKRITSFSIWHDFLFEALISNSFASEFYDTTALGSFFPLLLCLFRHSYFFWYALLEGPFNTFREIEIFPQLPLQLAAAAVSFRRLQEALKLLCQLTQAFSLVLPTFFVSHELI